MEGNWATEEMRSLKIRDIRLRKRLTKMLTTFSEHPAQSIPEACGGQWAATKAVYAFWDNDKVEEQAIRQAHYQASSLRAKGQRRVLAVQDTTELSYTGKEVAEALGHLSQRYSIGLLLHSNLLVSEQGVPLGLIDQQTWVRDPETKGKRHDRRQKTTAEKESQRWLNGVQAAEAMLPEDIEILHIADREGDIFDLFALPRRAGSELLIRVEYNRRVEHEARLLWDALRQTPIQGEYLVEVRAQANREARQAQTTVRYTSLCLRPPHEKKGTSVLLQFILVEEVHAPADVDPIIWLLATSLPVQTLEDALQCVQYYTYRWLIERFHFVLKSGCRIEKLYLQTKPRLLRALATFSIVAWRLLWLTYQARETPDAPCSLILKPYEWQALYCTIHRTPEPPPQPPSLREALRWIAQLGGFLGRNQDGDPGPMTIWRGLRHLEDIAATWLLLHPNLVE